MSVDAGPDGDAKDATPPSVVEGSGSQDPQAVASNECGAAASSPQPVRKGTGKGMTGGGGNKRGATASPPERSRAIAEVFHPSNPLYFWTCFAMILLFGVLAPYAYVAVFADSWDQYRDWANTMSGFFLDTLIHQQLPTMVLVVLLAPLRNLLWVGFSMFGLVAIWAHYFAACASAGPCSPWADLHHDLIGFTWFLDNSAIAVGAIGWMVIELLRLREPNHRILLWLSGSLILSHNAIFPLFMIYWTRKQRTIAPQDRRDVGDFRWWYLVGLTVQLCPWLYNVFRFVVESDASYAEATALGEVGTSASAKTLYTNMMSYRVMTTYTGSMNCVAVFHMAWAVFFLQLPGIRVLPRPNAKFFDRLAALGLTWGLRLLLLSYTSFTVSGAQWAWFYFRECAPFHSFEFLLCPGEVLRARERIRRPAARAAARVPTHTDSSSSMTSATSDNNTGTTPLAAARSPTTEKKSGALFHSLAALVTEELADIGQQAHEIGFCEFYALLQQQEAGVAAEEYDAAAAAAAAGGRANAGSRIGAPHNWTLLTAGVLCMWFVSEYILTNNAFTGLLWLARMAPGALFISAVASPDTRAFLGGVWKQLVLMFVVLVVPMYCWVLEREELVKYFGTKWGEMLKVYVFQDMAAYQFPPISIVVVVYGIFVIGMLVFHDLVGALKPHAPVAGPGNASAGSDSDGEAADDYNPKSSNRVVRSVKRSVRAGRKLTRRLSWVTKATMLLYVLACVSLVYVDTRAECVEVPGMEAPYEEGEMKRGTELIHGVMSRNRHITGSVNVTRMQHPKELGCPGIEFLVLDSLPHHLEHGIFQAGAHYFGALRLSSGYTRAQSDSKKDVRGASIKLAGVRGKRADAADGIKAHEDGNQDFLLITSDTFFTSSISGYASVIKAATSMNAMRAVIMWAFPSLVPSSWHADELMRMRRMQEEGGRVVNPLDAVYYSTTPYRLGTGTEAVKYRIRPCHGKFGEETRTADLERRDQHPDSFLSINMAEYLSRQDACFEFQLQTQGRDACANPIEDPTVSWTGPWTTVAHILASEAPGVEAIGRGGTVANSCREMQFNPWNALDVHRPLGAVNRMRRKLYRAGASYRSEMNQRPLHTLSVKEAKALGRGDAAALPMSTCSGSATGGTCAASKGPAPSLASMPAPPLPQSEASKLYRYDLSPQMYKLPANIASLPKSEEFSLRDRVKMGGDFLNTIVHTTASMASGLSAAELNSNFASFDAIERLYNQTIDQHPLPRFITDGSWKTDKVFAEQFLSGIHPGWVVAVTDAEQLTAVFGQPQLDAIDSYLETHDGVMELDTHLSQLIEADNLFMAEYSILQGIQTSNKGFFYKPAALFHVDNQGTFMPLAISLVINCTSEAQCQRTLFFPDRSDAWLLAKMFVASADAMVHEMVSHLAETHLVMGTVIIATHRRLPEHSALFRLMLPFFTHTLAINDLGKYTLLNMDPPGALQTFSCGLRGGTQLMERAFAAFNFTHLQVPVKFAAQGFEDPTKPDSSVKLPQYSFVEDSFSLWHALRKFVSTALERVYPSDAHVKNDLYVQAWNRELRAPSVAALPGMPILDSVDTLVDVVTSIIYTCTAGHSVINFPQIRYYGFLPNRPPLMLRGMPPDPVLVDERYIAESLGTPANAILFLATNNILSLPTSSSLANMQFDTEFAHAWGVTKQMLANHDARIRARGGFDRLLSSKVAGSIDR